MRSGGSAARELSADATIAWSYDFGLPENEGIALRTRALEDLEFVLLSKPDSEEGKAAAERIARIREDEGVDDLIDDLRAIIPFFTETKAVSIASVKLVPPSTHTALSAPPRPRRSKAHT